jgi:RNA polymerase sigma factor (sigma-70 family)
MMEDADDLRSFIDSASQDAFASLVRRHIDLVYSAAMRQVKNHHLAQDITQHVFLDLARKASTLRRETVLGAWLLVATRYAARDALRSQSRRQKHERQAAAMRPEQDKSESNSNWNEISDHLDEAMTSLSKADQRVIVLRYFEQRSTDEAAAALGISPEAARQRSHRALERLRTQLQRHGAQVSAAALGSVVAAHGVSAAPVELAAGVCAKVAGASALAAAPTGIGLMKGLVIFMSMGKSHLAIIVVAILMLAGGGVAYQQWNKPAAQQQSNTSAPKTPATTTSLQVAKEDSAPASAPTKPAESDWQTRFNQTYGLAEGQMVKRVPPPFIAERRAFLKNAPMIGGIPAEQTVVTLEWDGQAKWISISGSPGSLANFLQMGVRLKPYELEDWNKFNTRIPGDWVVRKGATAEEKLRDLEKILQSEFDRKVHFEQRKIPRDVIVVRGKYAYRTLDDSPVTPGFEIVDIVGRHPRPQRELTLTDRTIGDLCRALENELLLQVIDETGEFKTPITWRDHRPGSEEIDVVLQKLAWQTSLTFAREKRDTEVWFMTEEKP